MLTGDLKPKMMKENSR